MMRAAMHIGCSDVGSHVGASARTPLRAAMALPPGAHKVRR